MLQPIAGLPELRHMFIAPAPSDILRGLDGWSWLNLDGLVVIAVSAFGDLFLQAPDGTIRMLDTIGGELREVAADLPDFAERLQDGDVRADLLLPALVEGARDTGLRLEAGECYDFRLPPVLGGEMNVEAIGKTPFVVKLDLAGQLHAQVKDLPPGTPIGGITLGE
ncbi:T6SS immunity protein Tdi1 domain-containing protein [Sphingosinicella sp. BN140058]|uniref:T6SS immunity protein Tdi1 domain-containing protein n=1 Tax=Sphingosinicella sp. BN140058 TaxID=1892855 RepID=UPI0013EB2906|nr:T6SS immunity protein Tdi1 domain-containing protein [Sphingosinicella sp. BN140058]